MGTEGEAGPWIGAVDSVCLGEVEAEGHSLWIRLREAFSQAGSISEIPQQMETKKILVSHLSFFFFLINKI